VSVNDGFCALARGEASAFRGAGMPSLHQLRDAHAPLLLIDAASSRVQIGWLEQRDRWEASDDEAGVGIFQAIERLQVDIGAVRGFVFCDGPGSILGIRTAAMAIRMWNVLKPRPAFAYSSLALVAHALADGTIGVIADARRESWHHYQIGRGLRRLPSTDLAGNLVMPENFRHWSPLPADVKRVPYSVAEILPRIAEQDLFLATDAPDAYLHEEPSYVTWTPKIHQAPAT
jgi:tRNA threonylcarbamoyladenosine biosynthesis protein TsaB